MTTNTEVQQGGELPQDERARFQQDANDARFFPAEISFERTLSPSGRDEYKNSHLQSRWEGWQAALAQRAASVPAQPVLTVWEGAMRESNGKSNFTAMLMRKGASLMDSSNYAFQVSEYPERVRYEADSMRYLIGENDTEPCILDYDADKHSGYAEPVPAASVPDCTECNGMGGKEVGSGLLGPDWEECKACAPAAASVPAQAVQQGGIVIGFPDPEAVFANFCDREGYPSDGEMDEALRKAFYEGTKLGYPAAASAPAASVPDAGRDAALRDALQNAILNLGPPHKDDRFKDGFDSCRYAASEVVGWFKFPSNVAPDLAAHPANGAQAAPQTTEKP